MIVRVYIIVRIRVSFRVWVTFRFKVIIWLLLGLRFTS